MYPAPSPVPAFSPENKAAIVRGSHQKSSNHRALSPVRIYRTKRKELPCGTDAGWMATGLLEAEKKFRRFKGYQEILVLNEHPSRIPAEVGPNLRSRLKLVAGSITVPNTRSNDELSDPGCNSSETFLPHTCARANFGGRHETICVTGRGWSPVLYFNGGLRANSRSECT